MSNENRFHCNENIKVNKHYFIRKRTNLNFSLIKVLKIISSNQIKIERENKMVEIACNNELYEFDPDGSLFKALMRINSYRINPQIKEALIFYGYEPEKYLFVDKININKFDNEIKKQLFYELYQIYFDDEKGYFYKVTDSPENLRVKGANDLDLHRLYVIVCKNGGMENVTEDQKWKSIFYETLSTTNVSYKIRTFYKKYLYEFEFKRRFEANENKNKLLFKYKRKDKVYFIANGKKYYGTIKLRRNNGLNQYYIQMYNWSKEYNEWFSEDILFIYKGEFNISHFNKRKTRSSKGNNLIEDPLTREKHRHIFQGISKSNKKCFDNDLKNKEKNNKLCKNENDILNKTWPDKNCINQKKSIINYNRKKIKNSVIKNYDADKNMLLFNKLFKKNKNQYFEKFLINRKNILKKHNHKKMGRKSRINRKIFNEMKKIKNGKEGNELKERTWQKKVNKIDENEPTDTMTCWNFAFKRFYFK